MPPTTSRVNALRHRIQQFYLTETCHIEVLDTTSAGPFQGTKSYITVASDVPCRLIQQEPPAQPEAAMLSGQEVLPTYYILELPYNTPIEIDYRVLMNSVYYQVTRIEDALTDRTFKQVVITAYKGQGS